MAETTPITVLTGFLGAGKTTLLNHLLRQPTLAKTAVLVNEFGEVGLDHLLVRKLDDNTVLLNAGCLCCTVRGDLARALREMLPRCRLDQITRIVIETTGLADPAPILATLMSDPVAAGAYRLDGVVTVVDAVNGDHHLDTQEEAVRQVAVADRLVISKADLIDPSPLRARLRRLNPGAPVVEAVNGLVDPAFLLDAGLFDPARKSPDVARWLRAEAFAAAEAHGQDGHGHHGHGSHGHGGHGHGDGGHVHGDHRHDDADAEGHRHDGAGHAALGHVAHGHDAGPEGGGDHGAHDTARHGHAEAGRHDEPATHHHDPNRHDARIQAFCVTLDKPLHWQGFGTWLEMLITTQGENLLRVKGILNLEGQARPVVIHGVRHLMHPPALLADWPEGDPRTSRVVFITRDIPRAVIEEGLRAFEAAAAGDAAAS